jgi:hypothetical protein
MSRFSNLSHVIWHCQYHIVRVPKYRYRILKGEVKEEVKKCIHFFCSMNDSKVEEPKFRFKIKFDGVDSSRLPFLRAAVLCMAQGNTTSSGRGFLL